MGRSLLRLLPNLRQVPIEDLELRLPVSLHRAPIIATTAASPVLTPDVRQDSAGVKERACAHDWQALVSLSNDVCAPALRTGHRIKVRSWQCRVEHLCFTWFPVVHPLLLPPRLMDRLLTIQQLAAYL